MFKSILFGSTLRLFKSVHFTHQRSSAGSLSHEEDLAKIIVLQEVIHKHSKEQSQMKELLAALSSHVSELQENLDTARKDLIKSEEMNKKLERDVHEISDKNYRVVIMLSAWSVKDNDSFFFFFLSFPWSVIFSICTVE